MNKNKFKKIASIACAAALTGVLAFSLMACGGGNDGNDGDEDDTTQITLQLDKSTASVAVGKTTTISVTSTTTEAITWSSSDDNIATVVAANTSGKLATITGVAEGEATITAKCGDVDAKCTVTVTAAQQGGEGDEGDDYVFPDNATQVAPGGESALTSGWCYYAGESDASVSSCLNDGAEAIKIKYSWSGGAFWNVQLFYKDKLAGKDHGVTMTVVAPEAGNITVNGEKQELKEGENPVEVKSYSGSTLSIQFGVAKAEGEEADDCFTGTGLEFLLKNIKYTSNADSELKAPSFSYNTDTKVITITDEENSAITEKAYRLGFFAAATDKEPATSVDIANGGTLDISKIPAGEYTVRIQAYSNSNKIINSDWSETSVTIVSESQRTDLLDNQTVPGKWAYYIAEGATFDDIYVDGNGNVIVKNLQSANGASNWWNTQIFYMPEAGKTITGVTCTITAKQAGFINAHTETDAQDYELTEENNYTVNVSVSGLSLTGAQFKFFMTAHGANNKRLNGDITISNIVFTYAE